MKVQNYLTILFFVIFGSVNNLSAVIPVTHNYSKAGFWEVKNSGREVFDFNVGWRFVKGDVKGAETVHFDDSQWAKVNCPHGLEYNSSEVSGGRNYQGAAWYRKHFSIDKINTDKLLKLHFEAVMGKCKIWLNGYLVGEHFGGYLPFTVSLNEHLVKDGDNVLAVWADNSDDPTYPPGKAQNRLDFAYFGGIYRDVWLVATNKVYISNPNEAGKIAGGGIFTHINSLSDNEALLSVNVDIQNDLSSNSKVNAKLQLIAPDGIVAAEAIQAFTVKGGKSFQLKNILKVEKPKLWSPISPNLYRLEVVLTNDVGTKLDGVAIKTGLRKIEFKGKEGLFLNNKPYPGKLIGANRHQDFGYVGNALPNNGQWRDAVLLKNAGCDIVRAAHYPADPAFMDACDALGLFYIEATPGWQFWNNTDKVFEERVYDDIRQMVRRDRNYASIIMWEPILNETKYPNYFAKKAHELVHEEYPFSGAYTVCDNNALGQNYYDVLYAQDYNADYVHETRSFFCREFGDNVDDFNSQNSTSRAARSWGEQAQLVQAKNYAQSDYEKYTTWETLCQQPAQFVGGALWAGFDHQRGYANDPFYGGLTDVFRQKKYSYYMFGSQRDVTSENEPMIFIANEMTPFSNAEVTIFTNCEEVRLTVYEGQQVLRKFANTPVSTYVLMPDGQPTQSETHGKMSMPHPYVTFKDIFNFKDMKSMYRGGKKYKSSLVAEGLIDGKVVASTRKVPANRPNKLVLSIQDSGIPLTANGSDFVVVVASIVDERGTVKRLHENAVEFVISGEGEIIGDQSIEANPKRISFGTAPLLVRSTTKAGKIKIMASLVNAGINSPAAAEIVFESVASTDNLMYKELGTEYQSGVISVVENTSVDKLKQENEKLRRDLLQIKLKEEERNQMNSDINR